MQYADVALNVKTNTRQESFTYAIPPELLPSMKIGQRVLVPFHGRTLTGTVLSLRPTPPKIRGQLKSISRLAEPFRLFDDETLELCRQVAKNYGATIGEVFTAAAPNVAERTAKKTALNESPNKTKQIASSSYGLYAPYKDRLTQYKQLIEKALAKEGRVLVLFPDQTRAGSFAARLSQWNIRSVLMPPSQERTATYQAWVSAIAGEASVIVGTRKTVFTPIPNLKLIIVDGPSEFGYKEEQFPYYHAVTVAKMRAKIAGSHLVLGDSAPRLAEWKEIKESRLKPLKHDSGSKTAVTIIDTTTHRGLLSDALLSHLRQTLDKKGRSCLYFNRKGEGRFYRCLDCETASYCPRCDTLLTVTQQEDRAMLSCPQCQHSAPPPLRCATCQSYRLGSVGVGVASVVKKLAAELPDATIATLTADADTHEAANTADIVIATAQLFSQPETTRFDLLAIFHVDQLLHGSRWDTNEEAYLRLTHLAQRADHLLINTSEPEHPVLAAFGRNNIDLLYEPELADRQAHGYPPAAPVLRLAVAGEDKAKVRKEAEALYKKLTEILPNPQNILLPPSPIGTGKRRDKYRYQIIVKSALTKTILNNVPTTWQIDPEPATF